MTKLATKKTIGGNKELGLKIDKNMINKHPMFFEGLYEEGDIFPIETRSIYGEPITVNWPFEEDYDEYVLHKALFDAREMGLLEGSYVELPDGKEFYIEGVTDLEKNGEIPEFLNFKALYGF